MSEAHLFVYGTLRAGFDGPMARRLRAEAVLIGPARVKGVLYRIADYPGLAVGGDDWVTGDLFALPNMAATLSWLDIYEECAPSFPQPHEYRREICAVEAAGGAIYAWIYAYARDTTALDKIDGGDFLYPRP
ncbi:gamma-glutamylcyclotransferase [Sphingobium sp.]|uniref:gamma-glutamylcyclotransferase family protein n=1 Tax=Sphingobium sp. TaxID=1912891 RepID=UPI00262998A0|nr:gamma-glutamylcyclotransferase family protein [Sphingobium sp.]